ncbi:MAG: hypothetical protein Q4A16_01880 [Lautropia sp.]|nr:hypothetical protein [Lautropia sp.]
MALDVLCFHCFRSEVTPGALLREAAADVLEGLDVELWFDRDWQDDSLRKVLRYFLTQSGSSTRDFAQRVIENLRNRIEHQACGRWRDLDAAICLLFEYQPDAALSILVGDAEDEPSTRCRKALEGDGERSILQKLSLDALLVWCRSGPEARWVNVAPLVHAFSGAGSDCKWSDQARALLVEAPAQLKLNVAASLVSRITTDPHGSYLEPLSATMNGRLVLFDQLEVILGASCKEGVAHLKEQALAAIRERENSEERERQQYEKQYERFE